MEHTFRVKRGDSRVLQLTLTEPYDDSVAFNPTGWTLLTSFKEDRDADDTASAIQKLSTIGGYTVVNALTGRVNLELVPMDFTKVDPAVRYFFDTQAYNTLTGEVKTVAGGTLRVDQDVTKGLSLAVPTFTTEPSKIPVFVDTIPTSTTSAGVKNQFTYDRDYYYLCIKTGADGEAEWRMFPLTSLYQ